MFKSLSARFGRSGPKSAGRALIIDPGCQNGLGHHAGLNRMIGDHLRQTGLEVRTFVHKECAPDLVNDLAADAVLFPSIYIGVPNDDAELASRLQQRNDRLYKELHAHIGPARSGDQIIVHSITVWGLAGLARWLEEAHGKTVSVHIMLMFPPDLDFVEVTKRLTPNIRTALQTTFEQTLRSLENTPAKVYWSTQSQRFTEQLEPILGPRITTLHLPTDFGVEASPSPNNPSTVFLFPGAGRREKGIGNLPGAIRRFTAAGGKGRFVIQSVDDTDVENELQSLSQVEILGRQLSEQAYGQLVQSADAVLVAYDPARYGVRAGHIIIEALGSGRPVIVTKDTWMEEALATLPTACGTVAADYSADALGDALLAFNQQKSELMANARDVAPIIRQRHSREVFLSDFLG